VLERPEFATQVHTDHQTVAGVADIVAGSAGLTTTRATGGPLRAWLRRYTTTARNIHGR
jgi:hypothetical protein